MSWRILPHEGGLLEVLEVWSTGKDGGCILTAQGYKESLRFEVDIGSLEIHIDGKVHTHVVPLDDVTVSVRYFPLEPMRLARCRVKVDGTDEEWKEALGRLDYLRDLHGIDAAKFHLHSAS